MLKDILQDIGLNTNEAKTYLACLKLGTQDIKTISKETKLSVYDTRLVLSSLANHGFISKFYKGKDFFTAEQPSMISKLLENSKVNLEEKIKIFKKMIPQFQSYMSPTFTKPEISFYEGSEGIIASYEDTLTSKTDILSITSINTTKDFLPIYLSKYTEKRKTAGIFMKAILADSKDAREFKRRDKNELRTSRIISNKLLEFNIEMNIYDDKVSYFCTKENLSIIVKSKIISNNMRNVFDLCWKTTEIYEENIKLKNKLKKEK